jgi:hypothetical protein
LDQTRPTDLANWAKDPELFARECLDLQLIPEQAEIIRAVAEHKRVTVKAGRKVGKSFIAAVLALWWPIRYDDGRVVLTATADRQVREILWGDINRLVIRSRKIGMGGLWPHIPKMPHTGIRWPDGNRSVVGYTTSSAEGGAGMSGHHQLYIVDEASGVEDSAFNTILGNMGGGGTMLMISNPTKPAGFFYESFASKSALWRTFSISSRQSPNVIAGREVEGFEGLATAEWIEEMAEAWGQGTALYQVHVEGEFPTAADDCIIPLGDVLASIERYKSHCDEKTHELVWDADDGPLELGVDAARFGDDESVVCARRGRKILAIRPFKNLDGPTLAAKASRIAAEFHRGPIDGRPLVKVDVIGVGTSPYDWLARDETIRVAAVNVAERAVDADRFANKRAEVWHHLALWLRNGGCIPDDSKLQAELAAPRYDYSDPKGRMRVEAKDQFKRRLNRSPDRADAVALAVYGLTAGPMCFPVKAGSDERGSSRTTPYRLGSARGFG